MNYELLNSAIAQAHYKLQALGEVDIEELSFQLNAIVEWHESCKEVWDSL